MIPRSLAKSSVLICDIIAIGIFALLARLAHHMSLDLEGWMSTAWPFWLGTLLGTLLIKGRTGQKLTDIWAIWAPTVIVGLTIWGIHHHKIPHWSFIIVASVMSLIILGAWRLILRPPTPKKAA